MSSAPPPKVYRKKSDTAGRVAAELRRAIRRGELLPGQHIRQEEWSERMGVSSGRTREALKTLVAEQLVTYENHRGYFVARISPGEMAQLYQARRLFEGEVIRSMRWPTVAEINEIRKTMDQTLELIASSDVHGAVERARDVYFMIFDLSPLDVIVRELKRYFDMTLVYRAALVGSIEDPYSNNLSAHYERVIKCLESNDRDGLLELNSQERTRIVRDFFM
jgi:DNA-binding GntR family transcriptional regulator